MARVDRTRRIARLISVLSGNKKGSTITQIVKATGTSKATAYRDLELVRESGYTLEIATLNGEARYTLVASDFAREAMTPQTSRLQSMTSGPVTVRGPSALPVL